MKNLRRSVKKMWFFVCISVILTSTNVLFPQNYNEANQGSKLTVPWDEFKRLLKIEENDVILSMETFQKLVAQTGVKITPVTYGGNVILKQEQFKSLIDRMVVPQETNIPFNYLVTKAIYQGIVAKESISFQCVFTVQVLKDKEYIKIPLLSSAFALEEFKVDDAPGLVITENGYHNLAISAKGKHSVTTSFSMKFSLGRGSNRFEIPVQQTPITLLTLSVPMNNIDVEIPQAQKVAVNNQGNNSIITAAILPTHSITVQWSREIPQSEKLPAKLYTEVAHVISIDDNVLRVASDINCNVLHSEINEIRAIIPKDINILSVNGEHVGEWREITQKGERILVIPLAIGKKGNFTVKLITEKQLSEKEAITSFTGCRILDTVREIGFIGIVLNTSAEVTIPEATGVEKIAVEKLPAAIYENSDKPLMYGFKYFKHPYSIDINVKKHEKIAVPIAVVDSANMVTLVTFDGKIVHRLIYYVRNSGKQFMELALPKDAVVWSVFVDNAPVESSTGQGNKLLIPLKRSRNYNNMLTSFPVELIYAESRGKLGIAGISRLKLPSSDLMISQMLWSLYLPNDYKYLYFGTSLEKEELASGFNILGVGGRVLDKKRVENLGIPAGSEQLNRQGEYEQQSSELSYGDERIKKIYSKKAESKFKNMSQNDTVYMQNRQILAELDIGQKMDQVRNEFLPGTSNAIQKGVLPVHVQIPLNGQIYRFAKTIVNSADPLKVNVYYANNLAVKTIKLLIFIGIIWFLWKKRETIKTYFNKYYPPVEQKLGLIYTKLTSRFAQHEVSAGTVQSTHAEEFTRPSQSSSGANLWLTVSLSVIYAIFLFGIFIWRDPAFSFIALAIIAILSIIQSVIYFTGRHYGKQSSLWLSGIILAISAIFIFVLSITRHNQLGMLVLLITLVLILIQFVVIKARRKAQ